MHLEHFNNRNGSASTVVLVTVLGILLVYTLSTLLFSSNAQLRFRRETHSRLDGQTLLKRELLVLLADPLFCQALLENLPYSSNMSPTEKKTKKEGASAPFLKRDLESYTLTYSEENVARLSFAPKKGNQNLQLTIFLTTKNNVIETCSTNSSNVKVL